MVKEKFKVRV